MKIFNMMKTAKLLFGALLATVLLFASCAEEGLDDQTPGAVTTTAFTLTAETESAGNALAAEAPATRTGIRGNDTEGYRVVWERGDDIFAYAPMMGSYATGQIGVSSGFGTTKAVFSSSKPVDEAAMIWSPASLGSSADDLTWPAAQTYSASNGISGIPMYCTDITTEDAAQHLQFKNLGGLLRFTLKGDAAFKLTAIELSSSDPLAGPFEVTTSGSAPTARLRDDSSIYSEPVYAVRLDVPSVPLSAQGKDFYLSLMPGDYDNVKVKFIFAEQSPIVKRLMTGMQIVRSQITPADLTLPTAEQYQAGRLIRVDEEHDMTTDDVVQVVTDLAGTLAGMFLRNFIPYPVRVARILYYTTDPAGNLVEASGVVAYPYSETATLTYDRMVSVQHGTCNIADAPSYQATLATELLPVCLSATPEDPVPYVAVMADYLGYGRSRTDDLQTPYMHSDLTATTCADMIAAAGEYVQGCSLTFAHDKLDLIGYSQGGAATLQTLLELEDRGVSADRIGEVWAGAGPYDLVGFMDAFKDGDNLAGKTGYVPFTLRGISYGENLDFDYTQFFNAQLLKERNLDFLFSNYQLSEWHALLGDDMHGILHPDFYEDGYNGNADILRLVDALQDNSLVHKPVPDNVAKIKLFHSDRDDIVPYACTHALCEAWNLDESKVNTLNSNTEHLKGGISFMLHYGHLEGLEMFLGSSDGSTEEPQP